MSKQEQALKEAWISYVESTEGTYDQKSYSTFIAGWYACIEQTNKESTKLIQALASVIAKELTFNTDNLSREILEKNK